MSHCLRGPVSLLGRPPGLVQLLPSVSFLNAGALLLSFERFFCASTHPCCVILHPRQTTSCPTSFHLGSKEVCAPGRPVITLVVFQGRLDVFLRSWYCFVPWLFASSMFGMRESLGFLVNVHYSPTRKVCNLGQENVDMYKKSSECWCHILR